MGWSGHLVLQRLRESFATERLPAAERSAAAVQRANEARQWLQMLEPDESRMLALWAAFAGRAALSEALRVQRLPRSSFYRRLDKGASRIAAELTARNVPPR